MCFYFAVALCWLLSLLSFGIFLVSQDLQKGAAKGVSGADAAARAPKPHLPGAGLAPGDRAKETV